MGTGYYGAQIDYMNYVNMNGGVNGVMLTWQECETEYNAVKTVECYQRLLEKDGQRIVVFDTLGTPGAPGVPSVSNTTIRCPSFSNNLW